MMPRRYFGRHLASGSPCKSQIISGNRVSLCKAAVPGMPRNEERSTFIFGYIPNVLCFAVWRSVVRPKWDCFLVRSQGLLARVMRGQDK